MIVADTTVFVDFLRGHEAAVSLVGSTLLDGTPVGASVLTRMELLAGARDGETETLAAFFERIVWLPVSEEIADLAGGLAKSCARTRPGVGSVDYLIGATALIFGGPLWTSNIRHFPFWPDLLPPY